MTTRRPHDRCSLNFIHASPSRARHCACRPTWPTTPRPAAISPGRRRARAGRAARRARPEHRARGGGSSRRRTARATAQALRWLGRDGARRVFTYRDLRAETNRFANALRQLGVPAGERVFVLAGRIPELYIAVLGALKAKCVVSPLFSAFGPEPLATRLGIGDGRVLVTTEPLYRRKVAGIARAVADAAARDPGVRSDAAATDVPDTLDWHRLVDGQSADFVIPPTDPEDHALLHFTSGTTGRPKGAIHVHEAVVTHHITGHYALDLHDDDIFWCTADPGLGHRHQLRHHRAADQRRDQRRRRGRVRRADAGTAFCSANASRSGTPRRPRSA